MVYVISKSGKPLMPTNRNGAIRRWLRDGDAKVVRRCPFTVRLLFDTNNNTQLLILGIDPGSKKAGFAVRQVNTKNIVYASEVKLRDDIRKRMDRRRSYRRTRRNRKTSYRQPRFLNRTRKEGWLPPSVQSKVGSHIKEINFINSILPIRKVKIEKSKFDIHKIANPKVWGFWYQKGPQYGWENVKMYVLNRDKYKCRKCRGSSKDPKLQIHHIKYRSEGGTDKPSNLVTLCGTCHTLVHDNNLHPKFRIVNTVDATHISIISKRVIEYCKRFKTINTYGFLTNVKRRAIKISKSHINDAIAITYPIRKKYKKGLKKPISSLSFIKICVSKGDYQQTKGVRSQQRIPTGKIDGFKKFDIVRYKGSEYIIKGRRTSGYFSLMSFDLKTVDLKPIPKSSLLKRIKSRSSWIITQNAILNIY